MQSMDVEGIMEYRFSASITYLLGFSNVEGDYTKHQKA